MEEALVAMLLADSGVAALAGARIWWGRAPQANATRPYVVMRKVSGRPEYHMTAPAGLSETRVQLDAYGETYASARLTARALQAKLSGFRGSSGGKSFQGIFVEAERDLADAADAGTVEHLFGVSFDAIIWHD